MKEAFKVERISIRKFTKYAETCDTDKYRDIGIDIELHGRIVIILGNSGTGKSYIVERFEALKGDGVAVANNEILKNIVALNGIGAIELWVNKLGDTEHREKVAIIDNADIIGLMDNVEYKKKIENDFENQYILIMRDREGDKFKNDGSCFGRSPANIAEIEIQNEAIRLKYTWDIGER